MEGEMANRRGRPRKSKDQKLKDALERTQPAQYILDRRKLFSFVQPPADKRQDGRNGEIDSEVCDPIGQMCALGLLDGHGYDPIELRDKARFWGGQYAKMMRGCGMRIGGYERQSRATNKSAALTPDDLLFDKMDENLWRSVVVDGVVLYVPTAERRALWQVTVTPLLASSPRDRDGPSWAIALIDEALIARGRDPGAGRVIVLPTPYDRASHADLIRACVTLVEGSLRPRWAA
jgi:hypothetical protein